MANDSIMTVPGGAAGGVGVTARGAVPVIEEKISHKERHHNKVSFGRWFSQVGFRHLVGLFAVVYSAFPIIYVPVSYTHLRAHETM